MIVTVLEGFNGNVHHLWPERVGARILRPNGLSCYTFLHFLAPVKILIDGAMIETLPNACLVLAPNTPHDYTILSATPHDWGHFDETTASFWTAANLNFDQIYYPRSRSFISDQMHLIEIENTHQRPLREHMIDALFAQLFIQIYRSLDTPLQADILPKSYPLLQQCRQEMLANLQKKWTAKHMAEIMHISETHVYTLYKRVYGSTPTADLINARIISAQQQLSQTTKSLEEIALSLGYASSYHFSRQFRQLVGMSPRSYRTAAREQKR